MEGPDTAFRDRIADRLREIAPSGDEKLFEALLSDIEDEIESDVGGGRPREDTRQVLAAVESWASIASDAVYRFYLTAGTPQARAAGWSPSTVNALQRIAERLRRPLGHAADGLGASAYAINLGPLPAPISIALTWPVSPPVP